MSRTRAPVRARTVAAHAPAGPAPTIAKSAVDPLTAALPRESGAAACDDRGRLLRLAVRRGGRRRRDTGKRRDTVQSDGRNRYGPFYGWRVPGRRVGGERPRRAEARGIST